MSATPIGRDFKRAGRGSGSQFRLSREFFAGLGLGLLVAVGVFVWQRETAGRRAAAEAEARPQPRVASRDAPPAETEEPVAEYGFYAMLPKSEVIVPEAGTPAPDPARPVTPIERPGTYVLQPGVFRDQQEAERLQAKLLRLGVRSTLQRVAIDTDVFHRVRIGPLSDLDDLNRTRGILQRAEIDGLMIRVGD